MAFPSSLLISREFGFFCVDLAESLFESLPDLLPGIWGDVSDDETIKHQNSHEQDESPAQDEGKQKRDDSSDRPVDPCAAWGNRCEGCVSRYRRLHSRPGIFFAGGDLQCCGGNGHHDDDECQRSDEYHPEISDRFLV